MLQYSNLMTGGVLGQYSDVLVAIDFNIYGQLDGQLLYYNFAAGSFHIKKLCSRLYLIESELYLKEQKIAF